MREREERTNVADTRATEGHAPEGSMWFLVFLCAGSRLRGVAEGLPARVTESHPS